MSLAPKSEDLGKPVEFSDLFDASGRVTDRRLFGRFALDYYPRPHHARIFRIGIDVTRAAFAASRMFDRIPVANDDYVGQTGVSYIKRSVCLFVADPSKAGKAINTYPVNILSARYFGEERTKEPQVSELDFAATLIAPGRNPSSTTAGLRCVNRQEDGVTRATILVASREGEFSTPHTFVDSSVLSGFADVIDDQLAELTVRR